MSISQFKNYTLNLNLINIVNNSDKNCGLNLLKKQDLQFSLTELANLSKVCPLFKSIKI